MLDTPQRLIRSGQPDIVYETHGPEGGEPVIFAHGGGQTRHAWKGAAAELAASGGWRTIAIDMRGHGESGWAGEGGYGMNLFARDLIAMADRAAAGAQRAHIVGASLGGIASLVAEGMERPGTFATITLVDIVPRMSDEGRSRVTGFMGRHATDGFATLEDASDVIAEYLPHRPRPKSLEGLKKNLRLGEDGRWRWHWDPAFMGGTRASRGNDWTDKLEAAVAKIACPIHLVRGRSSELVDDEAVRHFRTLAPDAAYTDVAGARHMVAGDENDAFGDAVAAFLNTHRQGPATS